MMLTRAGVCAGLILSACTHIHFCDSLLFEMFVFPTYHCCLLRALICVVFVFFLPAIEIWKL